VSALGWGIIVGATASAVILPSIALREHKGAAGSAIFVGGFATAFLVKNLASPPGMAWPIALLAAGGVFAGCYYACKPSLKRRRKENTVAAKLRDFHKSQADELVRECARSRDVFFEAKKSEFPMQEQCLFDRHWAYVGLSKDRTELGIWSYTDESVFAVLRDISVPLRAITSVEVERVAKTESYARVEHVPIVSSQGKSPIGRAIVGGALLGPVGAIVGAASASGGKISTTVEQRTVQDLRTVIGSPKLVIGIRDIDNPVVRLSFNKDASADHWLHLIRAAVDMADGPKAPQ
jgi:hypothetical protein